MFTKCLLKQKWEWIKNQLSYYIWYEIATVPMQISTESFQSIKFQELYRTFTQESSSNNINSSVANIHWGNLKRYKIKSVSQRRVISINTKTTQSRCYFFKVLLRKNYVLNFLDVLHFSILEFVCQQKIIFLLRAKRIRR